MSGTSPKIEIHWPSLGRAILWFISNAAFGLAPLLFLLAINPLLKDQATGHEIYNQFKGGIPLFVCCALMGAVIVDILIERLKFRNFAFFAVNVAPFFLLGIICLLYLLILLNHVSSSVFTTFSKFYLFVICFTIVYCTLGKYFLYKSKN